MFFSKSRYRSSEMAHRSAPTTPTSASRTVSRFPKVSLDSESNSHGRSSFDRSPRFGERKPSKITTTNSVHEKRVVTMGTELQQQLGQAQVDLKVAKDHLTIAENAKSRALDELREMKKMAEEANSRLTEALFAQRRAQEISEVEKFRVDELEQVSIEAAQKRDEAWQLELDAVQKQRSLNATSLLAAQQELERMRRELSASSEAKDLAVKQADDARKTADSNAKKIEDLSSEIALLKESLSMSQIETQRKKEMGGSKWEAEAREASELAAGSSLVIESLKKEIERAHDVEFKLAEREELLGKLKLELSSTRDSEFQESSSLMESKKIMEGLEREIEIAKASENEAFQEMASVTKQLEDAKVSLQEAKLEIFSLTEKMQAMEASIRQGSNNLEASNRNVEKSKIDLHDIGETIESLTLELEVAQNDLIHAREREQLVVSDLQSLAEEASSLRDELRLMTESEEKSNKALEDLAMALREVTIEANQMKEELQSAQAELENLKAEAELYKKNVSSTDNDLHSELKNARQEIEQLKEAAERAKSNAEDAVSTWNEKEIGFINCIKLSEEEIAVKKEVNNKLTISLREAEEEAREAQEEKLKLMDSVKHAKAEASALRGAFELVSIENLQLRERLAKVENELERKIHENKCLMGNETAALEEVNRLTRSLETTSVTNSIEKSSLSSEIKNKLAENQTRSSEKFRTEKVSVDECKTSAEELCDSQHILSLSPSHERTDSAHLITILAEDSSMSSPSKESIPDPVTRIADVAKQQNVEPQFESIDKMSVFRTPSPTKLDGAETLNYDEYDHIDGHHLEEMECNKVSPARQKKKKALFRRFGDLLKKKNHK